jgi:hypothetical protein
MEVSSLLLTPSSFLSKKQLTKTFVSTISLTLWATPKEAQKPVTPLVLTAPFPRRRVAWTHARMCIILLPLVDQSHVAQRVQNSMTNVGVPVGGDTGFQSLALQIHFDNRAETPDVIDSTGIRVHHVLQQERENSAAALVVGDGAISLP